MDINGISEETLEAARNCKTPEELLDLAKQEGVELSDAELEGIAGGQDWCGPYRGIGIKF